VVTPAQGDIWWAEVPEAGRRPVLVVTRDAAIEVLRTVVVAPISRTVRGIPTEMPFDRDDGLRERCAASFDNVQPVPRWSLTERVAGLAPARRAELCRALGAMADC
jgi:mRNA interferase MazF